MNLVFVEPQNSFIRMNIRNVWNAIDLIISCKQTPLIYIYSLYICYRRIKLAIVTNKCSNWMDSCFLVILFVRSVGLCQTFNSIYLRTVYLEKIPSSQIPKSIFDLFVLLYIVNCTSHIFIYSRREEKTKNKKSYKIQFSHVLQNVHETWRMNVCSDQVTKCTNSLFSIKKFLLSNVCIQ